MSNVLIVGGTSGLGLELAKLYRDAGMAVYVTGRRLPQEDELNFLYLNLSGKSYDLPSKIWSITRMTPPIDIFVYAAGFYQEGRISDLHTNDIENMMAVGLTAPTIFLREILKEQDDLKGFIAVTSTSQWTPRLLEPVYTAVKAGLAALAHSVSLDERVQQVLVAGPAAMATRFWDEDGRDTTAMLDPTWVAEQIVTEYTRGESYREVAILRDPARIELRVSEK